MTPLLIVILAGVIAHTIVGMITRTPEENHAPLRWKAWHSFLVGIISAMATVTAVIVIYLATGTLVPYWVVVAVADLIALGWKLRQHHQRILERRSLQSLFEQPAAGEGA